jgi:2-aminoadipate transaminase
MVDMAPPRSGWAETPLESHLSTWATAAIPLAGGGPGRADAPGMVVFGGGDPDPVSLPWEELAAAARRALESDPMSTLHYGPASGDQRLRGWLADRLNAQEGAGVTADHFVLTHGSGQGINLVLATFLNPGDVALVERPTYSGGIRAIRVHGVVPEGVEMDDDGLIPEALEQAVERVAAGGRQAKVLYTMPTIHNPAGMTVSVARREAIAEVCARHGVLIMEDDAYGEIRCDGVRPPSYYTITGGEGAVRLSTFSKMLSTGIRLGWVTGRPDVVATLAKLRFDGGISPFTTRTVAEFCLSGDQDRHLERVIPIYREKRDRTISAMAERCSEAATWSHPEGGFFLWVKLNDVIDPARLPAAMAEEQVGARPGTQFFAGPEGEQFVRLCYSTLTVDEIEEGVRRLARAIDRCRR